MTFKLCWKCILPYVDKEPDWGPVGYVTYKRTYAMDLGTAPSRIQTLAVTQGLTGTEEWWLTCVRVIEGMYNIQRDHCLKFALNWDEEKAQESAREAYDRMFNFKWSPPGRGLSKMGTDYVKKNGSACLNNCAFVTTENINEDNFSIPFTFLADMSMLGVGVGFDVKGAGNLTVKAPARHGTVRVGDSRASQVELIGSLLSAYATGSEVAAVVDYSEIRPAGTTIRGFGGTASGPGPLKVLVGDIHRILGRRIGQEITATDITDLFNAIGRMVVSGGVRRTAEIALGTGEEFLQLKDPEVNQERLNEWGWCSNNSLLAEVGQDYRKAAELTAKNGEPGYFWLNNAKDWGRYVGNLTTSNKTDPFAQGTNPCSEQTLEDHELCTLVETYPSRHETIQDYKRTLKFAYMYAKTVTLMPTHNPRTNAVMMKNRRIGCSMSGVVDAINKFGYGEFREWLKTAYTEVQNRDAQYSNWLGVPRSIKTTSIKPSGTISKLPGVSEGCHWPYAQFYWQVIRFASSSPLIPRLREAGYDIHDLPKEPNTVAVYFAIEASNFSRAEADVSVWEKVKLAAELQKWYTDNQVSCTATFRPEEASDIKQILELFDHELKGISFLPSADHGYEHAPKQPITKEEYMDYVNRLEALNLSGLSTHEVDPKFCTGEACGI